MPAITWESKKAIEKLEEIREMLGELIFPEPFRFRGIWGLIEYINIIIENIKKEASSDENI